MGGDTATVLVAAEAGALADHAERALAEDHALRRAENGGQTLSKLDDSVDVLLLHRGVPGISGDQALDEIDARGLDCRVALVSAAAPEFDVVAAGFDDVLTAPVDTADLRSTVDRLLALNTYEQKYQELSSKIVKRNIMEVERTEAELTDSERFAELQARIEELERELAELQAEREFDERLLPT